MKHFLILFICSLWAISVHCKAVYKLKLTRVEVARYRKEYGEGRMWMTKPDRYTNAINCELYMYNVPRDTKVKIKMYEFLNNEYKPFAINLERGLCDYLSLEYKMFFYPDLLKIGANMMEPKCPVKPGNYSFFNFIPDVNNYPTTLPFHNFMMELGVWHGMVEIVVVKFYGTFDRDAVIREQYG